MNYLSIFRKKPVSSTILGGPFRGTSLILDPTHSKRKILGVYEYVLNPWINHVLPKIQVLWDVGANDGYFTCGCSHIISKNHEVGNVIAFEPNLEDQQYLKVPSQWQEYQKINFEFIPLFVGNQLTDNCTSLNQAYQERPHLQNKVSLIKVDVEGAELDVLQEASLLLEKPHHWVVEVHGDHLLQPVLNIFAEAKREVTVHSLKPHWLLGEEQRIIKTSWVTTTQN